VRCTRPTANWSTTATRTWKSTVQEGCTSRNSSPATRGRTEPSLSGELGVDAVVTALDVLDVEGEEESFEQPEFFREANSET